MDPISQIRAALVASAPVVAIVAARIAPLVKAQSLSLPAITLQQISLDAENTLQGWSGTDNARVQVTYWATTYDGVRSLADLGRSAISSAVRLMISEVPDFDPDVDLYRISQDFSVWVEA